MPVGQTTNKVPHYLVVKEGVPKAGIKQFQDISRFVSAVSFNSDIGNFPSAQLDLVIGADVEIQDGRIKFPTAELCRNDRVLVLEVGEPEYQAFTHRDAGAWGPVMVPDGIIVMWGVVADIMSARGSNRLVLSLILESELAYLDTTLNQELLGARGAGITSGPLLTSRTTGAGTLETILSKKFITTFERTSEKLIIDQSADAFCKLGVEGDGIEDLKVDTHKNLIVQDIGKGRVKLYPWSIVRLITAHCLVESIPKSETTYENFGVVKEELITRLNRIIRLMCLIEPTAAESEETYITLTHLEYYSFIRTMIIRPLVMAPSKAPSFWQFINSIMSQLHFYFTPRVLYRSSASMKPQLGSFQMMNPYRRYVTIFNESDLVSVENRVPGYKSIIKSIGFKSRVAIPSAIVNPTVGLTRVMYQVYRPSQAADFKLHARTPGTSATIQDFGRIPDYAYHKEIEFPKWLPPTIKSIERYKTGTTTSKDDVTQSEQADVPVSHSETTEESLEGISKTLSAFVRSALMIYGRVKVTSTVELVRLRSDCLAPLRIILLDLGKQQQTTGMISSVSLKWVAGESYRVTANLSHVTDLRDPYFRPLTGDLGNTQMDNLEYYNGKHHTAILDHNLHVNQEVEEVTKEQAEAPFEPFVVPELDPFTAMQGQLPINSRVPLTL